MKTPKNIIGLRELRENMETYIRRVDRGETITVVRRSTPLFKLTPMDTEESDWETVIDFTEIHTSGAPIDDVLKSLRSLRTAV